MIPQIVQQESKLVLLVDYCKKTTGTVGANGYEEIVMYYNNESSNYELHTYQKYDFMKDEEEHIFISNKETYDIIIKKIKELDLEKYENNNGYTLCGGDYICKFKSGDRIIRITTANLIHEGPSVIISIGNLMRSLLDQKNEVKS